MGIEPDPNYENFLKQRKEKLVNALLDVFKTINGKTYSPSRLRQALSKFIDELFNS